MKDEGRTPEADFEEITQGANDRLGAMGGD